MYHLSLLETAAVEFRLEIKPQLNNAINLPLQLVEHLMKKSAMSPKNQNAYSSL